MRFNELFDFEKFNYKWDIIETIPEFAVLKTCEQNPKWHSEGNCMKHVQLVCQEAIKYCQNLDPSCTFIPYYLCAALFHDIGKGVTTEFKKGNWHAYGHEVAGEKITRRLLWDEDIEFRETICSLVRWHMEPLNLIKSSHLYEKLIDLSMKVNLHLLFIVKKFDVWGSKPEDEKQTFYDNVCLEYLSSVADSLNLLYGTSDVHSYTVPNKEHLNKPLIYCHIMMGISGAGKSTQVEKIIEKFNTHNKSIDDVGIVVVSRDIARVALGYCSSSEKYLGTKEEENMVTAYCNEVIRDSAEKGRDIIIDDMNLKKKYRDNIKTLLKDYYVKYIYHYVETNSLKTNIERRKGQVSAEAIKNMIDSIEWPSADEYSLLKIYNN